jgi:3'(2'), 5'-bisphosphate nucleotidase
MPPAVTLGIDSPASLEIHGRQGAHGQNSANSNAGCAKLKQMLPETLNKTRNEIAWAFGVIALEAGRAILAARAQGTDATKKADGSPVTAADLAADSLIRSRLPGVLPDTLVITEETFSTDQAANLPARFVLVDPLDGTREFAAGRDEFTVNIALVEGDKPVAGTIYAPAMSCLYVAGTEAFRADTPADSAMPRLEAMHKLATSAVPASGMRATASRSHLDPATKQWLDERRITDLCSAGSSLKFCKIAEGEADVYPRLAPTMEWDTAAGQAILLAAGGCVTNLDGSPLRYGKTGTQFRNGSFIAWGQPTAP